ncbi:hypothetical protein SGRA_2360 [Saprospira grandis str. Lewin]|uniref:Uncharacterized protein n=1 Tax=Saprospira grandis (strain Lewin) TaxID=984262 RepID=H6L4R4_SAPGL|nr:hypothetical protein SGRA_2360 [Saprospira grandis str. Lewin]
MPLFFWGLPPSAALPLRRSQVCSALQRFQRFGLPPAAARLQASRPVASLLCGSLRSPVGPKSRALGPLPTILGPQ